MLKTNCFEIAISNGDTAYELKQPINKSLNAECYQFLNLGTNSGGPVDHHNGGFDVANAIVSKKAHSVVVACGTGISITIAANLINGVRCVPCYEEDAIRLAKFHYVSNALALGARIIPSYKPLELVKLISSTRTSAEKCVN